MYAIDETQGAKLTYLAYLCEGINSLETSSGYATPEIIARSALIRRAEELLMEQTVGGVLVPIDQAISLARKLLTDAYQQIAETAPCPTEREVVQLGVQAHLEAELGASDLRN